MEVENEEDEYTLERWAKYPYQVLDEAILSGDTAATWQPGRQLFLADGKSAKKVLANKDGLFDEHSDFFFSGQKIDRSRSSQLAISRASRKYLTHYFEKNKSKLSELVNPVFESETHWPETGNWMVYHFFSGALLCNETSSKLTKLMTSMVKRTVLSGARSGYNELSKSFFRYRIRSAIGFEVKQRRKLSKDELKNIPRDILDIVIANTEDDISNNELTDIFFSFVFATAGSIGFVLGWSIYSLAANVEAQSEKIKYSWIVKEALRLWPIAWNLTRRPAKSQSISGEEVSKDDHIVVCPYAVHRNPDNWDEPTHFKPERWDKPIAKADADLTSESKSEIFIPFGWGQHKCPAANLSTELVEEMLSYFANYQISMEVSNPIPLADAALAPPKFTLYTKNKTANM
jgi:hypothetical protein